MRCVVCRGVVGARFGRLLEKPPHRKHFDAAVTTSTTSKCRRSDSVTPSLAAHTHAHGHTGTRTHACPDMGDVPLLTPPGERRRLHSGFTGRCGVRRRHSAARQRKVFENDVRRSHGKRRRRHSAPPKHGGGRHACASMCVAGAGAAPQHTTAAFPDTFHTQNTPKTVQCTFVQDAFMKK